MSEGISGVGLAATGTGLLFLWSAVKGASVSVSFRELVSGNQPSGQNTNPIETPAASSAGIGTVGSASAAQILSVAASYKGQQYGFGAGHTDNPCASTKTDCSSYVSCVLNKVGIMKGSMATGGFANFGTKVEYAQRLPGDLIVWNGGTGGGHMGIIVDGNHMWNNPCTLCGGVQISTYPSLTRPSSSAIIRRVAK